MLCILISILIAVIIVNNISSKFKKNHQIQNIKFNREDNTLLNVKLAGANHRFKRISEDRCKDEFGNVYNFDCWYCAVAKHDVGNEVNSNAIKIEKDGNLLGYIPEDKLQEYYNSFGNIDNKDVIFILHYYEEENVIYGIVHFSNH